MPFRGFPHVEQLPSGEWLTQETLRYETREGDEIIVPAGFATDFASVPDRLRSFVAPWDETARPALLHDWLYYSHERSRKVADRLFREGLEEEGVGWWSRWAMWAAVRVGGRAAYAAS